MTIKRKHNDLFCSFEESLETKKTIIVKWLGGKSYRDIGRSLNMSQTAVMNNFWRELKSLPLYPAILNELSTIMSTTTVLDFSEYKYGKVFALISKKEYGYFLVKKTSAVLNKSD